MSIRSFYLDSRDIAGQLEEVTADNFEDVEVENQLIIEEYAEKEQARLEDYLLEILPKEKWALTLLGVLRDILTIFSDYELNDTKVQWFDKNEYNMFVTCLDRVCNLVEKYGLVGNNEFLAKEMNDIYRQQGFSIDDEEQTPEPQQGEQEAQQQQQEPQQVAQEQKEELPTLNGTEEEFKIFGRAVEKEYMRIEGNGYKWNLAKSLLAYMCGRLYCRDKVIEDEIDYSVTLSKSKRQLPANGLKKMFGVDVANNRNQLKAPPRDYNKIDDLWNMKR